MPADPLHHRLDKGPSAWRRLRLVVERVLRRRVLSVFDRRRVIYRWDPTLAPARDPAMTAMRFTALGDVPAGFFKPADPDGLDKAWYRDRFAEQAVIWAVVDDDRARCVLCIAERRTLAQWHMPIADGDKIVYAVVTQFAARGRGLAPQLTLAALHAEQREGTDMYVDCMAWNRPARRAFEKIGFRMVKTIGPLATARETDPA